MGIKVAGGIRTFGDAIKLIEEGATRIGTSHSVNIIKSCGKKFNERAGTPFHWLNISPTGTPS